MKTYTEWLKDPRWQQKRLRVMDREHWTCERCGSKENSMHVHHTIYRKGKKPWEYDDSELRVYCEFCHASIGQILDELKEQIADCSEFDLYRVVAYVRALRALRLINPLEPTPAVSLPLSAKFVVSPEIEGYADACRLTAARSAELREQIENEEPSHIMLADLVGE